MRYCLFIFLFAFVQNSFGQDTTIITQERKFKTELRQWTMSFSNFRLSDFKVEDTLHFENNSPQNFKLYKTFLSIYKPIITFLSDSSKFIDIYSYQLNLEKRGNYYEANPDVDQSIILCDLKTKYWNRIYFGTSSQWIDEVIWISKSKFILVGIKKSDNNKKRPVIFLGDTNKQTLIKYSNSRNDVFQSDKNYASYKLKKIRIKGL